MNRYLQLIILSVALTLVSLLSAASKQPNVLFILVDDLGWKDVACYGHPLHETPNIDKLASQGIRFTNAYAACPICAPSRAAILTGKFPSNSGFVDNYISEEKGKVLQRTQDRQFMKLKEVTLAEAFQKGGYQTGFIGKWHLSQGMEARLPTDQGFDVNIAGSFWGHPFRGFFSPYQLPNLDNGPKGEYLPDRRTGTDASGNSYVEIPHTLVNGDSVDVFISCMPTVHSVRTDPASITVDEIDINTIWEGAVNLGDEWLKLDWFDIFNASQYPWVYHASHGWLYLLGNDADNLWMWSPQLGWFWTSKGVYPNVYLANDTAWAWISGSGQLYNYSTGQWETINP